MNLDPSAHVREHLFSCLLSRCYRNTPSQAHPAQFRLLRFLGFLLGYRLLGLLSLVPRASLNQRAADRLLMPVPGTLFMLPFLGMIRIDNELIREATADIRLLLPGLVLKLLFFILRV